MKRSLRALCLLFAFTLLLSSAIVGNAQTGTLAANSGTRHTVCRALSSQAQEYYQNAKFKDVLELSGSSEDPMHSALFLALHDGMASTLTDPVSYQSLSAYWSQTDAAAGESSPLLFYADMPSETCIREQVWHGSHASFQKTNGGSDLHQVRPIDADVGAARSDYTMGNVRGVLPTYETSSVSDKAVLYYSDADGLAEVNDAIKGDVARILLYVYVCWQEPNLFEDAANPTLGEGDTQNDGVKVIESLDTLLEWMALDPVDTWEMSRNDQVENVQGNRNVFIDYPELAWTLFGRSTPAAYPTPSDGNTPQYQVTAVSADVAQGTVQIVGSVITCTPNTGFYTASATVSPTYAAVVTQAGDVFYLDQICADCTVTVQFAQMASITLTYRDAYFGDETVSWLADTPFFLPTREDRTHGAIHYTFVGWTDTPIAEGAAVGYAFYAAGDTLTASSDRTFYAAYTQTDSDGTNDGTEPTATRLGDVNLDTKVTAADAALLLRALVAMDTLNAQQTINACVTHGSVYSASDASAILRYSVSILSSF